MFCLLLQLVKRQDLISMISRLAFPTHDILVGYLDRLLLVRDGLNAPIEHRYCVEQRRH